MHQPNDPQPTPEWALPRRTLPDGCDGCGKSTVYCECVRDLDHAPCCDGCSHGLGLVMPRGWDGDQA